MHPGPWFNGSGEGMAFIPIIGLILLALWIWILIDCARRNFRNGLEKAIWIIALIFTPFIASVVYLVVIKFNNPLGLLNTDFRGPSPAPIPRPVMPVPEPVTPPTPPAPPTTPQTRPPTPPTPPTTPTEPPPRNY